MPSFLGRTLRHLADAYFYAMAPYKAAGPSGGTRRLLRVLNPATRIREGSGDSDVDFFLRLAVNNPEVYAAIMTISDRVSDLDAFTVQQFSPDSLKDSDTKGEWLDIENHPILQLLRRPNSLMTAGFLLGYTTQWFVAMKNAYWFLVTDTPGAGPICEIWPLPANKVKPKPENLRISLLTGELTIDYEYTLSSMVTLPGENVVHFRGPNLFDYWEGMSTLTPLQDVLQGYNSQAGWLGSYFGQGNAISTAVVSLPPELPDDEFETVKQDIIEQFGGQRRTAITRGGDLDVKTIQHSIEEMQVIEGLSFHESQARKVFKMPEGLSSSASGQARLAAETALARDVIQPMLNHLAETMTLSMIPYYEEDNANHRVAAQDIVPQDRALEVTEYQVYGQDRTLNENRKQQKLDPLKFTGALAPLQQLLDEVPQSIILHLAPFVLQLAGQPAGAPNGDDPLLAMVRQMAGIDLMRQLAGRDPDLLLSLMTNGLADSFKPPLGGIGQAINPAPGQAALPGPGALPAEVGSQVGQLPTQGQLFGQLGMEMKAVELSDAEQAAVLAALNMLQARAAPAGSR